MAIRSSLVSAVGLSLAGFALADPSSCTQMLIDAPGSSAARVCFTREQELLEREMTGLSREILKQQTPFKSAEFKRSQDLWRKHVNATCWLDAAGAGNSDAVFGHCNAEHTLQRLTQLRNLLSSLRDGGISWPMSNVGAKK